MGASLSVRRAWIEIRCAIRPATGRPTSLSVRRAWIEIVNDSKLDDNIRVALRKESVDRNLLVKILVKSHRKSLSVRRAWIEIWHIHGFLHGLPVALRKESVDRNPVSSTVSPACSGASLSVRRAWIEIGVDFAEDWLDAGRSP